jgi:hypothetical protein
VSEQSRHEAGQVYDRQLLLFGPRRQSVLDLWQVHRYGTDSYGNSAHVSIYGLAPADWYGRGVRLLGRTAVECTRDALADAIARDVAELAASAPSTSDPFVLDPFVGSGNTLYWIVRRVAGARGQGFELDADVCRLTRQNLALIGSPVEVTNVDYAAGLADLVVTEDELVIVFVAPPWGKALDPISGLDLRRTEPPIAEIVDVLMGRFPRNPLLLAVQVFETVEPDSLEDLVRRCEWWVHRSYQLDQAGKNHGLVLATQGWTPS